MIPVDRSKLTAEQPTKPPLRKPPGARPQPARRPALPPSFRPRKRRRRGCRVCCCFLAVFAALLAVAAAAAGGIFYLWFEPKLPEFHLQSVRFSRFKVTENEDGAWYLDAAAVARVEAKNPNGKLELYYGAGRVELAAGDGTGLGGGHVAGFGQGRANATSLRADTSVRGLMLDDAVGRRLRAAFRTRGLVVAVRVRTRLGYVVQGVRVGSVPVRVVCGGVSLKRLRPGGVTPKCTIEFLKWIKIR